MLVTKKIKWHMGHRVPNHKSKCCSNHGHTYFCEVTLESNDVVKEQGVSDEGMIMDFGDIKKILNEEVYDVLDHASMFYEKDPLIDALRQDEMTRLIEVPFIPTAENISKWIYDKIKPKLDDVYGIGLILKSVQVWETPTSTAVYTSDDEINHKKIDPSQRRLDYES